MLQSKKVKTEELFSAVPPYLAEFFRSNPYPWEMIPKIREVVSKLLEEGMEGYHLLSKGILVGEGVKIAQTATILPPAILGNATEIRPGAYLRGNVMVGEGCVIGNSTELKNCILLSCVQVPHYNYVGDSILGNGAHLGAGAVCSNLKSDGRNVVVRGDRAYETGLRKFGAILGDGVDVGCGCVLNPGTVIGQNTSVYPLTFLRGVYPADVIVKKEKEMVERKNFPTTEM